MHGHELRRDVLLTILLIAGLERIVDLMLVRPAPALDSTQSLEILLRLLVGGDGHNELRRILGGWGRGGLTESLGRATIERFEADDERALARGTVGAQLGVLLVREQVGRLDVVGC